MPTILLLICFATLVDGLPRLGPNPTARGWVEVGIGVFCLVIVTVVSYILDSRESRSKGGDVEIKPSSRIRGDH